MVLESNELVNAAVENKAIFKIGDCMDFARKK
jgi:hypothetical protein